MISTRFQQPLVAQGRALQKSLQDTLAKRDSKHPNPDPDIYEEKFRQLVENPLHTLLDVRLFLMMWQEYEGKQVNQRKRSRSLGDVINSHQGNRQDLLGSLQHLIESSKSVLSSMEIIVWHEMATCLEAQAIHKRNPHSDLSFIYLYHVHHAQPARASILKLFKEYQSVIFEANPKISEMSARFAKEKAALQEKITDLESQRAALPSEQPATMLTTASLDLNGLDQIEAESVAAKKLKDFLKTATTIDWVQIKILLQSDFSRQILTDPLICNGHVISRAELPHFRQLRECHAPATPDSYLAALLEKDWVKALLEQSPDYISVKLQEQIGQLKVEAKANADSYRYALEKEETTFLLDELGVNAFSTQLRDLALQSKKTNQRALHQAHCDEFLQPFREEWLYLDYLSFLNDPAFKSATVKQKQLALMLKAVSRRACAQLKVIASELTRKEHFRAMHEGHSGLEESTQNWLEEMCRFPEQFGALQIDAIQRNLEANTQQFFDGESVVRGFKEDMRRYWDIFKKTHIQMHKGNMVRLWGEALKAWQDETIANVEMVNAFCEKNQELPHGHFLEKMSQKAQAIVPADQDETLSLKLPKRRKPRWVDWLKAAAFVTAGILIVGGAAAAIVFSLGAATPVVVGAILGGAALGGGAGFGVKRLFDFCRQGQRAQAIGEDKRAADHHVPAFKSSNAKAHDMMGTTALLHRPGDVLKAKKPLRLEAGLSQSVVPNPSHTLNQNLRYSAG